MVSLYQEAIPEQRNPQFREYLETQIANDAIVDRYIRGFELIAPWLKPGITALEWGCRQAFMSCLMHRHLGGDVTLCGCDVVAGDFERFYRNSGLEFTLVDHQWELPYETGSFDFVLSNGVLEHVANEYESMKEIYRVLKNRWNLRNHLPAQPLCGLGEPAPYVGDQRMPQPPVSQEPSEPRFPTARLPRRGLWIPSGLSHSRPPFQAKAGVECRRERMRQTQPSLGADLASQSPVVEPLLHSSQGQPDVRRMGSYFSSSSAPNRPRL